MCMEKHVLVKELFTNELNVGLPPQIEQRSVIKYLLAEKCKPCEIYRSLPLQVWFEKFHGVDTQWLSSKKKFSVQQSVKKVMLAVNTFSYWKYLRLNSLYLLNDTYFILFKTI